MSPVVALDIGEFSNAVINVLDSSEAVTKDSLLVVVDAIEHG